MVKVCLYWQYQHLQDYAFFQPIILCSKSFLNLSIMLSDFPIKLCGFTYCALILNEKCTFLNGELH